MKYIHTHIFNKVLFPDGRNRPSFPHRQRKMKRREKSAGRRRRHDDVTPRLTRPKKHFPTEKNTNGHDNYHIIRFAN